MAVTDSTSLQHTEPESEGLAHQDQRLYDQSDQLRIPSARTNPEAILQWPIFSPQKNPCNYITDAVFEGAFCDEDWDCKDANQSCNSFSGNRASDFDEDDIPQLVQRFLELVHIQKPVLDVDTI